MKTDRNKVLTDSEISKFKSMSLYWDEVWKREDTSPLEHEIGSVYTVLGAKILLLIEHYIELLEENEQ